MLFRSAADGAEMVEAWKMAIEEERPVALITSRQNIKDLPAASGNRRAEAEGARKGGYVVWEAENAKATLLASGSEVSTLIEGAELLAAEGINVRVVSIPSEGLFRDQSCEDQREVLGALPRYGLTAGLPVTLEGLVGFGGRVHGVDHFGYSAPYKVLDEMFGFNGATVAAEVKELL